MCSPAIARELTRQQTKIELIASENIVVEGGARGAGRSSPTNMPKVIPASATIGGCEYADVVEKLAIERAKQLFGCEFANVQPNRAAR